DAPALDLGFSDSKLHRKGCPVLALACYDAADADDPSLSRSQISPKIAVMLVTVRVRHQHIDVAADDLTLGIAELPLGGLAERPDQPLLIDDDNRVGDRLDDRAQMRLASPQLSFGAARLTDVTGDFRGADDRAVRIANWRYRQRYVDLAAVLAAADGRVV